MNISHTTVVELAGLIHAQQQEIQDLSRELVERETQAPGRDPVADEQYIKLLSNEIVARQDWGDALHGELSALVSATEDATPAQLANALAQDLYDLRALAGTPTGDLRAIISGLRAKLPRFIVGTPTAQPIDPHSCCVMDADCRKSDNPLSPDYAAPQPDLPPGVRLR